MVTFITRMLQSEAVAKERAYAASAEREAEFIEEDDKAPSDAAEVDRAAGEGTSQQQQQAQPVYYQCRLPNGQVVLIAPGLMTMAPPATAPVSTGDDSSVAEGGERPYPNLLLLLEVASLRLWEVYTHCPQSLSQEAPSFRSAHLKAVSCRIPRVYRSAARTSCCPQVTVAVIRS